MTVQRNCTHKKSEVNIAKYMHFVHVIFQIIEITFRNNTVHQTHDNSHCILHTSCDAASHRIKIVAVQLERDVTCCLTFQWIKAVLLFCPSTLR
jgi:hypothetical protein